MHIFAGRDGRHYSHFAIAQTALALPFIALADAFTHALGPETLRAAIGRDDEGYLDTRETPAIFFTAPTRPIADGLLVAIFLPVRVRDSAPRGARRCRPRRCSRLELCRHPLGLLSSSTRARRSRSWAGFAALHAWRRTGRVAGSPRERCSPARS
jgi:hypothetical protein